MEANSDSEVIQNTDAVLTQAAEDLAKMNGVGHGNALTGMILRGIDGLMDIDPASVEELVKSRMDLNYALIQGDGEKVEKRKVRHTRAVMAFQAAVRARMKGQKK